MTVSQLVSTVCALLIFAAPMALAGDPLSGPAMGESIAPDEDEATSESLDDHHATSDGFADRTASSGTPDQDEGSSENPDDMEAGSERLANHEAGETELENLPDAEAQDANAQRDTLSALEDGGSRDRAAESASRPARGGMEEKISAVHAAKQALQEARQRAQQADDAYGTMMARDYPRGEARLKIVDERKVAHRELRAAEQRYDAALNGSTGPASY